MTPEVEFPISRAKAVEVLEHWARTSPPSRFAVYRVEADDEVGFDGQVVAWGLAFADRVDVQSVEPGLRGTFQSISALSFLFGESVSVVWIDPQPVLLAV